MTLLSLSASAAHADISFSREIAPILLKRCVGCHGDRANLGNYRAQSYTNLLKPGNSGAAPVTPGRPDASKLYQLISAKSDAIRMPKSDDPLSAPQIALFRQWIQEGAKFDGADRSANIKSLLGPRQHPAAPTVYRSPAPVLALALTPGGKEIAVGGYNEVTFWDSTTGRLLRRVGHLPQRIQSLSFSADGKRLIVAGGSPGEYGEVAMLDMEAGGKARVIDTFGDIVLSAALSADGKRVAAGGTEAIVRLYDVESGKRLWSNKVHSDWVTSVSISHDGMYVASASKDMTVKVYDAQTGVLYTTYTGHNRQIGTYSGQNPVYAVRFAPDSQTAFSAGGGKWVQVWDPVKTRAETGDAADMEERFAKQGHARYIEHRFEHEVFALTVSGGKLFAASGDGLVREFDTASGLMLREFRGHTDWVFALSYDAASGRLCTGSYDGEVRVWEEATGKNLLTFKPQPGTARTASVK